MESRVIAGFPVQGGVMAGPAHGGRFQEDFLLGLIDNAERKEPGEGNLLCAAILQAAFVVAVQHLGRERALAALFGQAKAS